MKHNAALSLRDQKTAIRLYQSGETQAEIGRLFGVPQRTIGRWLHRHGVKARRSGWRGSRRYHYDRSAWSVITPEAAYFAGFLMADGWIDGNLVCLEIVERDAELLNQLKAFLSYTGPIKKRKNRAMISLRVTAPELVKRLAKWGVIPNKTKRTRVPRFVSQGSFACFYFRGLFDGDGCAHRRKEGYLYMNFCGNPNVVSAFRQWTLSTASVAGSLVRRKSIHVAQFFCSKAEMVAKALYGNVKGPRLKRKERICLSKN